MHERTATAARAGLGDAQFETAWTQGRALSLAEAVAYTLEAVTEAAGAAPASSRP